MDKQDQIRNLSRNIAHLRKQHRLSKAEMARLAGISTATLTRLETGILPPRFSTETILCISDCFGLSPSELFRPESDP